MSARPGCGLPVRLFLVRQILAKRLDLMPAKCCFLRSLHEIHKVCTKWWVVCIRTSSYHVLQTREVNLLGIFYGM